METEQLYENAVALLRQMIQTPSFSKEEAGTAGLLAEFLQERGVEVHRKKNNVWAFNRHYNPAKPTILLNSHHDTAPTRATRSQRPSRATGCTGSAATTPGPAGYRCWQPFCIFTTGKT